MHRRAPAQRLRRRFRPVMVRLRRPAAGAPRIAGRRLRSRRWDRSRWCAAASRGLSCHCRMRALYCSMAGRSVRLQVQRPAAEQDLEQHQLVGGRGAGPSSSWRICPAASSRQWRTLPANQSARLAEHRDARTGVLAALVIVGGGGQQVAREMLDALQAFIVKGLRGCAEVLRVEAHVVAREQDAGGSMFDEPGGRRCQLLEACAGVAANLAQVARQLTQTRRPASAADAPAAASPLRPGLSSRLQRLLEERLVRLAPA